MVAIAIALVAAASPVSSTLEKDAPDGGAQAVLEEESPEVFLAKATLQQYLSRIVRKDWDGVRRLTHAKALAGAHKRGDAERSELSPWADRKDQLKTFRFRGARQVGPGVVAIGVGEDIFHADRHAMSTDDPSVYLLFRSHGSFVVGDKKADSELSEVSDASVRASYRGYVDRQSLAQARRGPSRPSR